MLILYTTTYKAFSRAVNQIFACGASARLVTIFACRWRLRVVAYAVRMEKQNTEKNEISKKKQS